MSSDQVPVSNMSDDPEEMAATLLTLYTPKFEMLVNTLSQKALRRLVKKLVQYPLNEKDMNATSSAEKNAFLIGDRLLEAKYMLMINTYAEMVQNNLNTEESVENKENKENG